MKLTFRNKNRGCLFIFCISMHGLQEILSTLLREQMVSHCPASPSLGLPALLSLCSPGQGRVPSTLNWQETTQSFYHLRTSSITRWSKCWEGATAVIIYGAFSPIFLRPRFFFSFFCTIALIQRELFQVPEIRNSGASWNSRDRNPGAGVRLVKTLSGVKGGKSPSSAITS